MATIFTPFERLVLQALASLLRALVDPQFPLAKEIDLAIRTSDGQQRADEAQKRQIP